MDLSTGIVADTVQVVPGRVKPKTGPDGENLGTALGIAGPAGSRFVKVKVIGRVAAKPGLEIGQGTLE